MSPKKSRMRIGAATVALALGTGLMVAPAFDTRGENLAPVANAVPKESTTISNPDHDNAHHNDTSDHAVCANSGNGKVGDKNPHCTPTETGPAETTPESTTPETTPESTTPETTTESSTTETTSESSTTETSSSETTSSSPSSSASSSAASTTTSSMPESSSDGLIGLIVGIAVIGGVIAALAGSSTSSTPAQNGPTPNTPAPAPGSEVKPAPESKSAMPSNAASTQVAQAPAPTTAKKAPTKLANTGIDAWLIVLLGALLAAAGGASLLLSRKAD